MMFDILIQNNNLNKNACIYDVCTPSIFCLDESVFIVHSSDNIRKILLKTIENEIESQNEIQKENIHIENIIYTYNCIILQLKKT